MKRGSGFWKKLFAKNSRLRRFYRKLERDRLSDLSAAFSYYALLSLAPFAVGLILASTFLPEEQIESVFVWVGQLLGSGVREAAELVWSQAKRPGPRSLAGSLSLLAILVFSSAIFNQIQGSLNHIFRVKRTAVKQWLLKRLLSIALVFGLLGALLLASIVSSLLSAFENPLGLPIPSLLPWAASLGLCLAIALLYRWLPDVSVRWKAALPAAFLVVFGMSIARYGFAFYLSSSTVLSLYGAAATLPAFLVWVYVSSYLFFLGAELTHYWNEKFSLE